MSTHPVFQCAMAFETYMPVLDDDIEYEYPNSLAIEHGDNLEGDTLVKDVPNENGCYSLTRCPSRKPSPDCPNCERLAVQLENFRTINMHLMEGVEEQSLFLQAMESQVDLDASGDKPSTKFNVRVLVASKERLLARNQELVAELQAKKDVLKDVEALNRRNCELGVKLEEKITKYKKLNADIVKSHAAIKKEKYAKTVDSASVRIENENLKMEMAQLVRKQEGCDMNHEALKLEKAKLAKRENGCEDGCVKRKLFMWRELSWAQIAGLTALLLCSGWNAVWWLLRL